MKKISLLSLLLLLGTESPTLYGRDTIKLSPQVRIIERERTVPTIPMGLIQQFISQPKFIMDDEIEDAGSVIANANQSLLSTEGDRIYARNLDEGGARRGQHYIILRPGKTYRDPLEDEVLAQEVIYIGEAVLEKPGEPAVLKITKADREIKLGDRLLPKTRQATSYEDFHPHSPTSLEGAYIIAGPGGASVTGRHQTVVINQGSDDGIERGHLLAVNKNPRVVSEDEMTLPKQRAGTVLVFKVFPSISHALVMSSILPINVHDQVSVH